jgi:hypothetical protein
MAGVRVDKRKKDEFEGHANTYLICKHWLSHLPAPQWGHRTGGTMHALYGEL